MNLLPLLIPLNIGEDLGKIGHAIMTPIYWAISGILTLFHHVFTPLFGYDSGWGWLLAILMLTVVVRLVMLPLYIKQLNSSRAMQTLQPKIKALQDKYGADRERLGQETMKLYEEEGVNPMASCAPLLIQMPIFFGLFTVLNGAARGNARGYFFERDPRLVESLSNAEVFFHAKLSGTFLPLSNGFGGTQILAGVLVLLMTALLFFQQLHMLRRNMPPSSLEGPMGQQSKMMLMMMPFMYFISGPAIPIGVLFYWFFSNLWTLGQQWIIIRTYPTPGTPAFADWEDRMRAQGKDPDEIERNRANKGRRRQVPKKDAAVADDGKVTRQNVKRQTTVNSDTGKQQIQRQQVQRQSRAQRKKS